MLIRLLVVILIGDGLMILAWGRCFLVWQRRVAPNWYRPVLDRLLGWPESLLRLGGVKLPSADYCQASPVELWILSITGAFYCGRQRRFSGL